MSIIVGFVELIAKNPNYQGEKRVYSPQTLSFNTARPFPMKLEFYVENFLYHLSLPDELIVYAYILIESLLFSGLVSQYNVHRMVFTALSISYKLTLYSWVSDTQLEVIGGLQKGELVKLEKELLRILNWRIKFFRFKEVYEKISRVAIELESKTFREGASENENLCDFDDNIISTFSELEGFFCMK
ncbi:hypothetical protein SteCoe_35822 [Stentor coeruleus]|uniref:Cyclin N-terminal domain-containing protein n=1 Tax=Stentor coeruleus TaxID=5963 RepID=A0A1R2ARF8_9CILI|nr:hypothetical protein SteCoe_35822 [Stentor coeruleus]